MTDQDDFAWTIESLRRLMDGRGRARLRTTAGPYESVDEIFERRTRAKGKRAFGLMILIWLIPLLLVLLLMMG